MKEPQIKRFSHATSAKPRNVVREIIKKLKYFSIVLFILFYACDKNKNVITKPQAAPQKEVNYVDEKESSINESINYLFLSYYKGMTRSEFWEETNNLISQGKLECNTSGNFCISPLYKIDSNCELILSPVYRDDRLHAIELSDIYCLYHIFQEKYNLPNLKKSSKYTAEIIENNPYYNPQTYFLLDGQMLQVPNALIDNETDFISEEYIRNKPDNFIYIESNDPYKLIKDIEGFEKYMYAFYLPKDSINITKDSNINITLYNTFDEAKVDTSYSIQFSEKYFNFIVSPKGKELFYGGKSDLERSITNSSGILSGYYKFNSKLRIISYKIEPRINAIYRLKDDYEKDLDISKNKRAIESNKKSQEEKEIQQKKLNAVEDL